MRASPLPFKGRSNCFVWVFACAMLVPMLAFASQADGTVATKASNNTTRVYGSATTYFTGRQVLDPNDPMSTMFQTPIYQYLTVGADDVGVPGFAIHLSGWGRLIPTNQAGQLTVTGELMVGNITYTHPKNFLMARAGRQILYESAGNNIVMDGFYLKGRPGKSVEISAFGGWVPYQGNNVDLYRGIFGGRLAYRPWDWGNLGLSYTGQTNHSTFDRSTLGIDYSFRYRHYLEFSGYILTDMVSLGFQETSNALTYMYKRDWRFTLDYGVYNPSARIAKTSIFSVFTDSKYHKVGADFGYYGQGWLGASLYGRYFYYDDANHGYELGFRPVLRFDGAGAGSSVGVEIARLKGFENAYTQARAFAIYRPQQLKRLMITADVNNYFYDRAVQGYDVWRRMDPTGITPYRYIGDGGYFRSHVVSLTAGYEIGKGARVQGDVAVHVNPDFTQSWSGLLKFQYDFDLLVK